MTWTRRSRASAVVALCLMAWVSALEPKIDRPVEAPLVLNETLHHSVNVSHDERQSLRTSPLVNGVVTLVKSARQVRGANILLDSLRARDGPALPYEALVIPGATLSAESRDELASTGWRVVSGLRPVDHPFPADCGEMCEDLDVINAWKLPYTKVVFISPVMIAKSSIVPIFELIQAEGGVVGADDCQGQFSTAVLGFAPSLSTAHSLYLHAQQAGSMEQASLARIVGSERTSTSTVLPRAFNCEKRCLQPNSHLGDVECAVIYAPGSCLDFDTKS